MMKKITLLLSFLMLGGIVLLMPNKADAQAEFGIKLGANMSNLKINTGSGEEDFDENKMKLGPQGGFYANIPIAYQLYIQPSLMFQQKGTKIEYSGDIFGADVEFNNKMNLGYVTLPVDILFKPGMPSGGGSWIIGAGPYVAYGVVGKNTLELKGSNGEESVSEKRDFDPFKHSEFNEEGEGSGDPFMNRFDAGVNVQLGFEMASGFNIVLNADLGLINVINKDLMDDNDDSSAKNTSFGLTLGYTF